MKCFSRFKQAVVFLLISLSLAPLSAIAADPDYSALTDSIDFASVGVAIMAVATAILGLYVIIIGVKKLLMFVRTT